MDKYGTDEPLVYTGEDAPKEKFVTMSTKSTVKIRFESVEPYRDGDDLYFVITYSNGRLNLKM